MTFLAMTLGSGQVMLLGEVVSKASVSYESILRDAVRAAGYDHEDLGMDWRTVNVPGPQLGTLGAPLGAPGSRFVRWRRYRGIAMCPKKQQKTALWLGTSESPCGCAIVVGLSFLTTTMFIARSGSKSTWVKIRCHFKRSSY